MTNKKRGTSQSGLETFQIVKFSWDNIQRKDKVVIEDNKRNWENKMTRNSLDELIYESSNYKSEENMYLWILINKDSQRNRCRVCKIYKDLM